VARKPPKKLPEGVENWYSVYREKGIPLRGERGYRETTIPFDLHGCPIDGILELSRVK